MQFGNNASEKEMIMNTQEYVEKANKESLIAHVILTLIIGEGLTEKCEATKDLTSLMPEEFSVVLTDIYGQGYFIPTEDQLAKIAELCVREDIAEFVEYHNSSLGNENSFEDLIDRLKTLDFANADLYDQAQIKMTQMEESLAA